MQRGRGCPETSPPAPLPIRAPAPRTGSGTAVGRAHRRRAANGSRRARGASPGRRARRGRSWLLLETGNGLLRLGKSGGECQEAAVLRECVDAIADLEVGAGKRESCFHVAGLLARHGLPLRDRLHVLLTAPQQRGEVRVRTRARRLEGDRLVEGLERAVPISGGFQGEAQGEFARAVEPTFGLEVLPLVARLPPLLLVRQALSERTPISNRRHARRVAKTVVRHRLQ